MTRRGPPRPARSESGLTAQHLDPQVRLRALLGAAFFALAVKYVVSAASDAAKQVRGS